MTTALAPNELDAIASACRRHRVARLHAFGSVVGPDFRPGESDILEAASAIEAATMGVDSDAIMPA